MFSQEYFMKNTLIHNTIQIYSVYDKLSLQKSNYLTEDEIYEYVTNYELGDKVPIFDESEIGDDLFNTT